MFILILIMVSANTEVASIEFSSKETCETARDVLSREYLEKIPVVTSIGCYKK